jgi:hypothetical protein
MSELELKGITHSKARQRIVDEINSIDVSEFDPTPWTSEHIIRPLPGAQESFLTTTAQVAFYGGEFCASLSQR